MDTKALKDKILQLAIQGKLVPQDPTDEPASTLLERIKAEKEQLIRDKKIKKDKPLPEITGEEKPFEIPDGWEWVRLGDIIKIKSGNNLTSKQMNSEGNIPVYGGNGITGYHDEFNVTEQTLVIGRVGFYCGSVHITESKAWVTDNAFITTFSENNVDFNFLSTLLKATNLKEKNNATAQPVISGKNLYPIVIPLPPLSEQKRIVEKVDQLFSLIVSLDADKDELIKAIKLTRSKVLQEAIQGRLVEQDPNDEPASVLLERIKAEKEQLVKDKKIKKDKPLPEITEEEKPFEIPDGWEWVRLGEVTNYKFKQTIKPEHIEEDNWVLELEDIEKETSKLIKRARNEERKSKSTKNVFEEGQVLFGKLRPYLKKVMISDMNGVCSTEIVPFNGYCEIDSKYIMYYMKSTHIHDLIDRLTHGMDMPRLGTENAINLPFPLPPLSEQKRIVEKVDAIMRLCDELEDKICRN